MNKDNITTLKLNKENFKFSAAHFLIFDKNHAERLHGHNYYVSVEIDFDSQALGADGFFVDFASLKKVIKARLDLWDEFILLPQKQPDMLFKDTDEGLKVLFRERRYLFPKNEVVLLPITNTSVENLSKLLAEQLAEDFKTFNFINLRVQVEETKGQSAQYSIST